MVLIFRRILVVSLQRSLSNFLFSKQYFTGNIFHPQFCKQNHLKTVFLPSVFLLAHSSGFFHQLLLLHN